MRIEGTSARGLPAIPLVKFGLQGPPTIGLNSKTTRGPNDKFYHSVQFLPQRYSCHFENIDLSLLKMLIPRKIPLWENCQKVCGIFPIWQFLQEICHMYLLQPRHLLFNYEKVKVCHGKLNSCNNYGRPKVNDKFDSV